MTTMVLGAVLLTCLGLLLGTTWTTMALQSNLRRQAEERRRLNEEWSAVRTAHQQLVKCPRCGRYFGPMVAEDPMDDD